MAKKDELGEKPGDGIQASPGHPEDCFTPPKTKRLLKCFSSLNSTVSLDHCVFSNQAYISGQTGNTLTNAILVFIDKVRNLSDVCYCSKTPSTL